MANGYLLLVLLVIQHMYVTNAVHESMNMMIQPRSRECFYEDMGQGSPAHTVEAFVRTGGNVDVYFTINGPLDLEDIRSEKFENPLVEERVDAEKQVSSDSYTFKMDFKPKTPGTYAFCLDNRRSRFLAKIVELDVRLTQRVEPIAIKIKEQKGENQEEEENMERAKESISKIRKGLAKIQLQQQRDRHRLALHSETNISSHNRVVAGSIIETAFFIAASLFQIVYVRRWFAQRTSNPTNKQRA
jgi:hypothetical protein